MSESVPTFDDQSKSTYNKNKKPIFLIVLCVLSSLYIVFTISPAIIGVFDNQNAQEKLSNDINRVNQIFSSVEEIPPNYLEDMSVFLNTKLENLLFENSSLILILLLEAYGVWLMYNLKRNGFWLYLISNISLIILNYIIFSTDNIFAFYNLFFCIFLSIIFVSLYYLNLKYLTD